MKNPLFILLVVLNGYFVTAQIQKYHAVLQGEKFVLVIDGSEYYLQSPLGTFTHDYGKDFLYSPIYFAEVSTKSGTQDRIKINFTSPDLYDNVAGKYKIGFLDATGQKQFLDIETDSNDEENNGVQDLFIPKSAKLFLMVNYDSEKATELEYDLPLDTELVNIDIKYPSYFKPERIIEVNYNDDKSEVSIGLTDEEKLIFYKDLATAQSKVTHLYPVNTNEVPSTLPEQETFSTLFGVEPEDSDSQLAIYKDWLTIKQAKSITSGLKTIAKNNDILVAVIENKAKNENFTFDNVIHFYKNEYVSALAYDTNQITKSNINNSNHYVFHKVDKADVKWLTKKEIDRNTPSILFIDKNGDVLIDFKSNDLSLADLSKVFGSPETMYATLLGLQNVQKLYKMVTSNKFNPNEFITILSSINTTNLEPYGHYLNAYPAENSEEINSHSYYIDEQITYNFPDFSNTKLMTYYSDLLHANLNQVNEKLIPILAEQLDNSGFIRILFNAQTDDETFSDIDFQAIDVLLTNSEKVNAFSQRLNELNPEYPFYYGSYIFDNETITDYILKKIRTSINYHNLTAPQKEKIVALFQRIFKIDSQCFLCVNEYYRLSTFNTNENYEIIYTQPSTKTFIQMYAEFFKSSFNSNTPYIVSLDNVFSKANASEILYNDWSSYKNYNADLANNIAWAVVVTKEVAFYEQALVWADFAVTMSKQNYYFLDTLAHLQYFTGDKKQAIITEQKALELAQKSYDSDSEAIYQTVLQKINRNEL